MRSKLPRTFSPSNNYRNEFVSRIKDNHANVVIFIDDIKLMGDYTINGKILILPITGAGKCNLGFGNATFVYDVKWTEFDRNGVTYATLGNDTLNYDVKSASFLFENLFNGDKQLGIISIKNYVGN